METRGALPANSEELEQRAAQALETGDEERILPALMDAAAHSTEARLWQWTGLLQRAIDDHQSAMWSFHMAATFAPEDIGIAHGLAQVTFEAGLDARALFDRALSLGPPRSDLLLGRTAARMAMGEGEAAAAELEAILAQSPFWLEGHAQLAQLQALIGRRDRAYTAIERALAHQPSEASLWHTLLDLNLKAGAYAELSENAARAAETGISNGIASYSAIAASELGDSARADKLFGSLPGEIAEELTIWRIRHLIRTGRAEAASALVDQALAGADAAAAWPYAHTVWKLTGDARSDWLDSGGRLIATFDLTDEVGDVDKLAALLRSLHVARASYLDQSVHGGTQTDGPLLTRIDPEIRQLRTAVTGAVRRYIAELPPEDPSHPLLGQRRDRRIRFAGSWSVLLKASGYHESHVHPQGWISSAFYVTLPDLSDTNGPNEGWLSIGQPPPSLGVKLAPTRLIEPQQTKLVLFPSWNWHGTLPFARGERLTAAFDVRSPL
jgi:tetratricopeptide (TPR) repeat protein